MQKGVTMATWNDTTERRKQPRFGVSRKFQTLAIARFDIVRCHIVDISATGLSFCYEGANGHPVDIFGISILLHRDFWGVSNIPVQTMWVREYREGDKIIRLSGVRFGEMPPNKRVQLEHFITRHANE